MTRRLTIPRDFTDDFIDMLDRCRISFVVEEETYDREPYSWGQSRGRNIAVSARLHELTIFNMRMQRAAVVAMLGEQRVRDIEDAESERRAEDLTYA